MNDHFDPVEVAQGLSGQQGQALIDSDKLFPAAVLKYLEHLGLLHSLKIGEDGWGCGSLTEIGRQVAEETWKLHGRTGHASWRK